MRIEESISAEYKHEYDYYWLSSKGRWVGPEVRYHNPTNNRERVIKRHQECKDYVCEFGHEFEGIYGYAWMNCRLVEVTKTITIEIKPLEM